MSTNYGSKQTDIRNIIFILFTWYVVRNLMFSREGTLSKTLNLFFKTMLLYHSVSRVENIHQTEEQNKWKSNGKHFAVNGKRLKSHGNLISHRLWAWPAMFTAIMKTLFTLPWNWHSRQANRFYNIYAGIFLYENFGLMYVFQFYMLTRYPSLGR